MLRHRVSADSADHNTDFPIEEDSWGTRTAFGIGRGRPRWLMHILGGTLTCLRGARQTEGTECFRAPSTDTHAVRHGHRNLTQTRNTCAIDAIQHWPERRYGGGAGAVRARCPDSWSTCVLDDGGPAARTIRALGAVIPMLAPWDTMRASQSELGSTEDVEEQVEAPQVRLR